MICNESNVNKFVHTFIIYKNPGFRKLYVYLYCSTICYELTSSSYITGEIVEQYKTSSGKVVVSYVYKSVIIIFVHSFS